MANIIIIGLLVIAGGFAVRSIIRKKKSGGCCGCSSCPSEGQCHKH